MPQAPGPLGWIRPLDRTLRQHSAHAAAAVRFVRAPLPFRQLAKGERVILPAFWRMPEVVEDVGWTFSRVHQKTGSCVWAGGTAAVMSTIATQRMAGDNPTKAFVPFTLHNYASSRARFGHTGEGEGSLGSTFADSLREDGIRDWPVAADDEMPDFTHDEVDGVIVGAQTEMRWSSIRNPNYQKILPVSKQHLFGSTAECRSPEDIQRMIQNGYGVTWACNNYIGSAKVKGSGENACCLSDGGADNSGGHQWSIQAVWEHPDFGPLYGDLNNWPAGTYPRDPAGLPVCACWRTEKQIIADLRKDAEVYGLSELPWFPAKPRVIDYAMHV
jgi:hypothetical protein